MSMTTVKSKTTKSKTTKSKTTKSKTTKSKTKPLPPLPTKIRDYETPVPFTEDFKWPKHSHTFTASSYMDWVRSVFPIIDDYEPTSLTDYDVSKGAQVSDDMVLFVRILPIWRYESLNIGFFDIGPPNHLARVGLIINRGYTEKWVYFDDFVKIPTLISISRQEVWMSLTPNEVFTQRGQIRRTKGNTAMAGLGMGWAARRVLQRNKVKKLTVYEKDAGVIDFFGKPLKEEFGDRLDIINTDVYDVDIDEWMQYDVSIWDIWIRFGHAASDRKYRKIRDQLRKSGRVCVGWGDTES